MDDIDRAFGILRKVSKTEMEHLIKNVFLESKEIRDIIGYDEYINAKQEFMAAYGWTIREYNKASWDESRQ